MGFTVQPEMLLEEKEVNSVYLLYLVMIRLIFGWQGGCSEISKNMKLSVEKTGLGLYLSQKHSRCHFC